MSGVYYHKKNGIWYVNVMIDGEQYHRSTRQTTRKGAGVWAEEFVQLKMLEKLAAKQAALQPPPPPPILTFKVLAERWETAQDEDTSAGHIRNVRDHVRLHLVALHDLPINTIGIEQVQPLVKAYRATHSVASTNGLRRTINLLFGYAVRAKFIPELPFDSLKKRKEPAKKRTALTEDQYGDLAASAAKAQNRHIPLMVLILVGTGVRRIDVLHMKWEDLDLAHCVWSPIIIKDGDPLVFELESWLVAEIQKLPRVSEYVFAREDGQPHGPEFLRRTLARAGKELGVGRLGTHALRASYITFLADQGVPITTISALVGHSDVRLTMRYLVRTRQALDKGMRAAQHITRAALAMLAPPANPESDSTPPEAEDAASA